MATPGIVHLIERNCVRPLFSVFVCYLKYDDQKLENERDIFYAAISYLIWVDPCEFFFLLSLTKIKRVEWRTKGKLFLKLPSDIAPTWGCRNSFLNRVLLLKTVKFPANLLLRMLLWNDVLNMYFPALPKVIRRYEDAFDYLQCRFRPSAVSSRQLMAYSLCRRVPLLCLT